MKINDLSKELNIDNKELIDYLKSEGLGAKSHAQNATDEMIMAAREHFVAVSPTVEKIEPKKETRDSNIEASAEVGSKTFMPDDQIPCRSVLSWGLTLVGVDKTTVYSWEYFGDVEYVAYKDLQSWRKRDVITAPLIIIEDADLCYQWRKDLGNAYKYYLDVEYPEEFFDLSDDKFRNLLSTAPNTLKEVIKTAALVMVRNKNYPTVQKLTIIDEVLGTCLKDFL